MYVGFGAGYGQDGENPNSNVGIGNLYNVEIMRMLGLVMMGFCSTGSQNTFVGKDFGKGGITSAPFSSGNKNIFIGYQEILQVSQQDMKIYQSVMNQERISRLDITTH